MFQIALIPRIMCVLQRKLRKSKRSEYLSCQETFSFLVWYLFLLFLYWLIIAGHQVYNKVWKMERVFMGWSRTDLRSVYGFWGHLIWASRLKKGIKRKTNVLHGNKKLLSVTLFSKLIIESEHINTVNRAKNYRSTLKFFMFPSSLRL